VILVCTVYIGLQSVTHVRQTDGHIDDDARSVRSTCCRLKMIAFYDCISDEVMHILGLFVELSDFYRYFTRVKLLPLLSHFRANKK